MERFKKYGQSGPTLWRFRFYWTGVGLTQGHFSKSQQVIPVAAQLRSTPSDRVASEMVQCWKSNLRTVLFGPPGSLLLPAFHLCPLSHLPLMVLDLNLGSGVATETASAEDGRQQRKACGERGMGLESCDEEHIEAINI